MIYIGSNSKVQAWSIPTKKMKYEFAHGSEVGGIVIGREGTPLENRIVSIGSYDKSCRISNLETGDEVKKIDLERVCRSIAVDNAQTMIVVGNGKKVIFIDTTSFTKVKEVALNDTVYSLAFNKRNDYMLAVTSHGEVHSFKF